MSATPKLLVLLVALIPLISGGSPGDDDPPAGDGGADGPSGLRWYRTCGDPVCRPDAGGGPGGVPACTTETAGSPCNTVGSTCDPGLGCGVLLRCSDRDPTAGPGGCPIS